MIYTKDMIIKELMELAVLYNCTVEFTSDGDGGGSYYAFKELIVIDICLTQDLYYHISTFIHEYIHHYCNVNGILKWYHRFNGCACPNSLAFRSEQYVDKFAQSLFEFLYPNREYAQSYRDEQSKLWLENYRKEYHNPLVNKDSIRYNVSKMERFLIGG